MFLIQAAMPVLGWRWLLALSSTPCFILLIFFPLTPESPRYLCSKGRTMDATIILERIARMNNKALPPGILTYTPEKCVDNYLATSETALLIAEDNAGIEEDTSSKPSGIVAFQALWSHELIRSSFLLWFVYVANYFAYYGVILLTSELSNGGRRCASVGTHLIQPKGANLYSDVLVTSLAVVRYR
uniref:Major facilitator superfamily (MFS) profile domain-containing protein n=1 Tax=Arundo donax TaxID=35708 RepID=A0A0A9HMR4_ARUDO